MGIRCDQLIGLNDWASDFVRKPTRKYTDYVRRVYEDGMVNDLEVGGEECLVKRELSGQRMLGMFDESYPLNKYTFPSGRVVFEFEQASPWSSGPVMFLALKDENGEPIKKSLWTEEEIEEYL